MTKPKTKTPTQATIARALKALHLRIPYYSVTQRGDVVTFTTRDGAVTWIATVPEPVPSLPRANAGAEAGEPVPTKVGMVTNHSGSKPKSVAIRCQGLTKSGRQCKAKATKGVDPPRCVVHSMVTRPSS